MPTSMKISAQFATSMHSPEHIAIAEQLGYDRAWLFDTPHESPDVWMMLALAAERTTTIGLGPGVLVPALRHPLVNASATAGLTTLAPGRVAVAFGTGFGGADQLEVSTGLCGCVPRDAHRCDGDMAGQPDAHDAPTRARTAAPDRRAD